MALVEVERGNAVGVEELTGAAWLDPVAGFVIAAFAIHEGREAWHGELVEDD
jgi:divalent metal cation (Fe/Co/Zn/Cd) transporter